MPPLRWRHALVFKGDELYLQHEDTEINLTGYYPGVSADEVAGKMDGCFDEISKHTKDSETVLINLDHMVKTDRNAQVTAWSCIGDNGKALLWVYLQTQPPHFEKRAYQHSSGGDLYSK